VFPIQRNGQAFGKREPSLVGSLLLPLHFKKPGHQSYHDNHHFPLVESAIQRQLRSQLESNAERAGTRSQQD
jgi:hypothetical protein